MSKIEIEAMINSLNNIKHQLIIEILYSSGIRLSELLNLKVEDIDFLNNIIKINQGKGAKDRYTIISKDTAKKIYKFIKSGRIIKGRNRKYSARSVHVVIRKAAEMAKVTKRVTPHILRHSFATHLLESGVSIRHIQKLLGHSNLQTTQIYTHVASNEIKNIKSPLD